MAYENLILGVLFCSGIFAVKSGVGLAYVMAGQKKKGAKVGAFLLSALIYGSVFALAATILTIIDPIQHLAAMQAFVKSGMLVHVIMAFLLLSWGLLLLIKGGNGRQNKSNGWLLLTMPCPVCATVILFSMGFLATSFPDHPKSTGLALYLAFMLINIVTMGITTLYRKRENMPAESLLGGAMVLMALYFFISMAVIPQFADVDKIYRLALYQGKTPVQKVVHLVPFSILTAVAFMGGYGLKLQKIRRIT